MADIENYVELTFEETSEKTDKFLSYTVDSNYNRAVDTFAFSLFSQENFEQLRKQTRPLQPISIHVNGALQLRGRIDSQSFNDDAVIEIRGRSYLAELADGAVDPAVKVTQGMTLPAALLAIFKQCGTATIEPNWNAVRTTMSGGRATFAEPLAEDPTATKVGKWKPQGSNQGTWQLAHKLVTRHGYTMQPTLDRSALSLSQPEYRQAPLYRLSRVRDGSTSNVLSGNVAKDYSDIPTMVTARGRDGKSKSKFAALRESIMPFADDAPVSIGNSQDVKDIVLGIIAQQRIFPDQVIPANAGLLYKPMVITDQDSKTLEEMQRSVKRELAARLKDTLQATYIVEGHEQDGAIWTPDTLVRVQDDLAGIDENLWVEGRIFSYQSGQGARTTLKLLRPDSFVI